MTSYFEDVLHFHRAMNHPIGKLGGQEFDSESLKMGMKLIKEEFDELMKDWEERNFEGVVDNSGDLIWVVSGLMVRMGVDLDAVWAGIRAANMAKKGGPVREDGKLLKPPGWKPPDTMKDVAEGRLLESIL